MILQNLHNVQQVILRAYVQNVMFFATFPFYLAQERRPTVERSRHAGANQLCARTEDVRWLR
jgi:hypothetical protein